MKDKLKKLKWRMFIIWLGITTAAIAIQGDYYLAPMIATAAGTGMGILIVYAILEARESS